MKVRNVVVSICETILKIALLVVACMLIYRGANMAYEYGYRIFKEPPMATDEGREVVVTIPEGMSSKEMGELLYKKGLIRDEKLFQLQYMLSEFKKDLLPGKFTLKTSMTVDEMLEAMTVPPAEDEE